MCGSRRLPITDLKLSQSFIIDVDLLIAGTALRLTCCHYLKGDTAPVIRDEVMNVGWLLVCVGIEE
jgi:hypothetical protein